MEREQMRNFKLDGLRKTLATLVQFAYDQGFHELGYDIVTEFEAALSSIPAVVEVEREACAKLCDTEALKWKSPKYSYAMAAAEHCAKAIRSSAPHSATSPAPPEAGGGWLPISTRPEDGVYLVANKSGQVAPWIRGITHNAPGTAHDWEYGESATHWQPLPAAPNATGSGEG